MMLVEFKLGRGMFMYLYCGWYEVKRKEKNVKKKDQKKKRKTLEKQKQKKYE